MEFHQRGFDLSAVDFRSVNQRQQFDDRLKMDFHWSWQTLAASALEVQVVSILNKDFCSKLTFYKNIALQEHQTV